jgi:hypothetical protein
MKVVRGEVAHPTGHLFAIDYGVRSSGTVAAEGAVREPLGRNRRLQKEGF